MPPLHSECTKSRRVVQRTPAQCNTKLISSLSVASLHTRVNSLARLGDAESKWFYRGRVFNCDPHDEVKDKKRSSVVRHLSNENQSRTVL